MALDRNGTGTSQGSSSNQKGGSGEGSRNQGSGAGNRGSSASKNSSNSGSSGKGSSQSGGGKSSPGQSKASSDTGGKKSNSASQSSGSSVKSGGSLAGNTGLASGTSASESESGTKKGVAGRVSSVNQALSSYGAAPSTPNHNISSIGGPSMYGMNDGSLTSKVKGAFGFGPSTNFNETIKTDNVNGVIGNLQRKAQEGTLTTRDKANIADASGAYNKQAGANVVGGTLLGGAGKAIAGLAGDVGNTDSYFSGIGRDAANGDLDSSRLVGQRDSQLGSEGGLDSTLKAGVSLLSGFIPGAGLVMTGAVNGLTQPASGFGAVLNQLNEQAGNTVNSSAKNSSKGSDKDYLAPPRQSLASTGQSEGTLAFDSSYYDPSRFNVTAGKRGY
ncbi:hypothetical protein [Aeromonas enteropelogenes]|uniref:hypothetical protein n=1 Tax=Aeromonas enteropelogenes TaxID=29489 RepID=UPI00228642C3|nr:hypothetical protein [Aeromonas enteropelogenes]MCZ0752589.1 hypothetical protein [Aeromonas enteropelogenes]